MKLATISLLALLTAACGSNADQAGLAGNSSKSLASDDISSRIAKAEVATGIRFHDMTLDERAEVLAARDTFGQVERTNRPGRAMSYEDMIAQARSEEEAGY